LNFDGLGHEPTSDPLPLATPPLENGTPLRKCRAGGGEKGG